MKVWIRIVGYTIAACAALLAAGCGVLIATPVDGPRTLPPPDARSAHATLYLMGDNQERQLFGAPSTYSEMIAQLPSKVAIRSLEQDLYSKFTVQYVS